MFFRLSLLTLLLLFNQVYGQTGKLFSSDEAISFTLTTDIEALQNDRNTDPDYHDAWLRGVGADGEGYEMKVQIKARGNFRRNDLTCQFPPLRIRFSKGDSLGPFDPDKKLKLVTHCDADRYIKREYMVYRTYNQLSPWSLKVRPAKIIYRDTLKKVPDETHFAFFIEDLESFCAQRGGWEEDPKKVAMDTVDRDMLTLVHIFQYMIGNPDHSVDRLKNTKLVCFPDKSPIPIPYDFDWSEVVDAPYTKLPGETRQSSMFKKRKFKPLCRTEEEFEAVFDHFEAEKDQIWSLYENSPWMDKEDRDYSLKYYKDFYKTIRSGRKVNSIFLSNCE
jgi:hypothetical protein